MAKVNIVNKQVRMELDDIIRFQLLTHCYINHISLSDLELDCLTQLGKIGSAELTTFCSFMSEKRLEEKLKIWADDPTSSPSKRPEASPQTIRNILIKIEKEKLITKEGKSRKKIELNPELKVQIGGNILLNYKMLRVEPTEV